MDDRQLLLKIYSILLSKKAQDPVLIHFDEKQTLYDYFFVCHGESRVQVQSMADALLEELVMDEKIKPSHVEGYQNAEWVLMDYGSIIVHIFQKPFREHYRLEDLWGDFIDTSFLSHAEKTSL
jgi:ribosome-associated protein